MMLGAGFCSAVLFGEEIVYEASIAGRSGVNIFSFNSLAIAAALFLSIASRAASSFSTSSIRTNPKRTHPVKAAIVSVISSGMLYLF